ncbi:MAG: 3-phosphoshikimate 1-carboxyvinyltransferase [Fimbriimonadales bacterium]|nr:MAG: 3-phosphoshikimate 1-carboxyvinyltransferase [Fimbriimonadales bacterium]
MSSWRVAPARRVQGVWRPPGDKSITHRAAILGLLARGATEIENFLEADDCLRTLQIAQHLGAQAECVGERRWRITGRGGETLSEPTEVLDAGNSGTTTRLMAGVLSSYPIFSVLTGDASLRRRPMRRVVEPLQRMGARIDGRDAASRLPLAIRGGELRAIKHLSPIASAQVKSCVLLAGLNATGVTEITEPSLSRDHTERMLQAFGAELGTQICSAGVHRVRLRGGQVLEGQKLTVPGDFSSAAFWIAAALLLPGSDLVIEHVGVNPTRVGLLEALAQAGVHLDWSDIKEQAGEPTATLRVKSQPLGAMYIGGALIPSLLDEVPILALLATQASGETEIRDAAELRVKESDRIEAIAKELRKMGAQIEPLPDGLRLQGPTPLHGAEVHSHGDHRIAMTLAIAGLIAQGETRIQDVACVQTSFPEFEALLSALVEYD